MAESDRISQLQDRVIALISLTSTNLTSITNKASYRAINGNLPVGPIEKAEQGDFLGEGEFEQLKIDLALDYVKKAKEVQALIELLPDPEDVGPVNTRIEALEGEMRAANDEYRAALARSEALEKEVKGLLRKMVEETR